MMASRRRAAIALVLMGSAAAGAVAMRPTRKLADLRPKVDLERMFPAKFGEWVTDTSGPVQLISPTQEALINKLYSQTLSRTYVNREGRRIMLSVAYGGDQSDATRAHRPEVCYPAQGFRIDGNRKIELEIGGRTIFARQLETQLGARNEPVLYWLSVADITTTSGIEQKLAQIRYGLRGYIPDGMLVRVSSIDGDAERAHRLQVEFVKALEAAVDPDSRERIFGAKTASATASRGVSGSPIA